MGSPKSCELSHYDKDTWVPMVTVDINISCDPLALLHTIIQHITYVHMHLFPHTSLCVPSRWCRGDLHRCLCEGAQWTHLWCNIDQGILNCLLLLVPSSIPLTSTLSISSREIQILKRYSWTCTESIVTQMHPFNGKRSQVRPQPSHPPEASTHYCWTALLFFLPEDWQPLNLKFIPFQLTHTQWVPSFHCVCGLTHHFKFPCHRILVEGKRETVFLLSGDDLKVHLYREEWRLSEVCVCTWEKYSSNCDP